MPGVRFAGYCGNYNFDDSLWYCKDCPRQAAVAREIVSGNLRLFEPKEKQVCGNGCYAGKAVTAGPVVLMIL